MFIQIFGGLFTYVGNVGGKLFQPAFSLTHFEGELFHVNRGEYIFTYKPFVQDDSILKVVTFPRHERHFKVTAQRELAVFGGKTFGQDIAFGDLLP
ncbi:hypothetical protein SDC9_125256 [bioreactor metagenome]|uniref:Uncharacterized protein n=1 Tax=bioreactor metagenome TaxID=1076179 RepID=A0A645CMW8_9ZZZZ